MLENQYKSIFKLNRIIFLFCLIYSFLNIQAGGPYDSCNVYEIEAACANAPAIAKDATCNVASVCVGFTAVSYTHLAC